MNGRKVEDGGILYDENETDEDDELQESPAASAAEPVAATPGIDWNEGGDLPEGVTGWQRVCTITGNSALQQACEDVFRVK